MKKFVNLMDLIFPKLCYSCGEVGSYLCRLCEKKKIKYLEVQNCHVCKKEVYLKGLVHRKCREETYLDGILVALHYDKFIEKLLADFKYEFITDLKGLLCRYLALSFRKFFAAVKKDFVVTFVPLHKKRQLWRGYNQTEVMSDFIAKASGFEQKKLLIKEKNTRTQVGLGKLDRQSNVRGAFVCIAEKIPERIVIVDDVVTTGATLEECAKTLRQAGTKEVYGLVIARG